MLLPMQIVFTVFTLKRMFLSTSSQIKKQLEFKASGFSSKSSDSFVIVTLQVNSKMSYDKKMK